MLLFTSVCNDPADPAAYLFKVLLEFLTKSLLCQRITISHKVLRKKVKAALILFLDLKEAKVILSRVFLEIRPLVCSCFCMVLGLVSWNLGKRKRGQNNQCFLKYSFCSKRTSIKVLTAALRDIPVQIACLVNSCFQVIRHAAKRFDSGWNVASVTSISAARGSGECCKPAPGRAGRIPENFELQAI